MHSCWYEVIIEDKKNLSGKAVYNLLSLLIDMNKDCKVMIGNLEGANIQNIVNNEFYYHSALTALMTNISDALQFDWCDFFCYKNDFKLSSDISLRDYPLLIKDSLFTLRCVDSSFFYLYISKLDEKLLINLLKKHSSLNINLVSLTKVNYPN